MHIFTILNIFLLSFLGFLFFGNEFLGYGDAFCLIFLYFVMEYFYSKKKPEYDEMLREILEEEKK